MQKGVFANVTTYSHWKHNIIAYREDVLTLVKAQSISVELGLAVTMNIFRYTVIYIFVVARRFEKEYGCLRLSTGEALRRVITQFPDSKLTQVILSHLKTGQAVPDDLCAYALERALLDVQCQTRG